jgi:hypothetical protein
MQRLLCALLAAIGMASAGLVTNLQTTSAQDGGSLIIGVSRCPEGYDGADAATDCGDTPDAGIDFSIGTPGTDNTETTASRGDGLVTFSLAPYDLDPEGPDLVSVGEAVEDGTDYAVFCTRGEDAEPVDIEYETLDFEPGGPLLGISFDIETGDDIACEWYNIPPASDDDDTGGETELPNTGAGVAGVGGHSGALPVGLILATLVGAAGMVLRRTVLTR